MVKIKPVVLLGFILTIHNAIIYFLMILMVIAIYEFLQ